MLQITYISSKCFQLLIIVKHVKQTVLILQYSTLSDLHNLVNYDYNISTSFYFQIILMLNTDLIIIAMILFLKSNICIGITGI